ncbi:LytR family transcriptional regulator [Sporolactobacillus shoreae]|uniref:LytR family transcriptional regulator n=1 Tax=Sporolactobacillus shoreae TaxID=1465501 RepID=A0A4Z0GN05_9BACL|nr:LCP family protein [Sporolactobacillus shoreae]TGA98482.1 LytR family transcriptional regulator [Sporolactobacillus shoreae]
MRKNDSNTSRSDLRKSKKKHKVLRIVLLVFVLLVATAAGFTAYEVHRLNPENRFSNLKVIGGTGNAKQSAGVFNMLLIGSDARKGDSASHTDSMVLIHANLKDHTYNMLSIPRDTRVYMDGYGYTKLTSVQYISQVNHGTQAGIVDAVKAVSNLTGVPINFYAETNYWGLQDMVDAIGGIDMNLPFKVTLTHAWNKAYQGRTYQPGMHSFDGATVTELVHERYSLPGTDYGRQQLQEAALIGIAKKMMQPSNVTRFPALSQSLPKFLMATNMSSEDMVSIGLSARGNFHPEQQIKYRQVKGRGAVMYDDVLKANNDQVILAPDQLKTVIKNYFTN